MRWQEISCRRRRTNRRVMP